MKFLNFLIDKLFRDNTGSFTIDTAFVNVYKSNIMHLSQQQGSRFRDKVRNEVLNGEAGFFERIGSATAQVVTSRHGDTPVLNIDHSRRMVVLVDAEWGDLIDKLDRVKLLINPDDAYVQEAVWGLGRQIDDQIISAALGNAYAGKAGATATALPSAQKVVCHDGSTLTGVGLNVRTLRAVRKKFDSNDVDDNELLYFAYGAVQKDNLLAETEVTSSDYAAIKALVEGKIDTFMGFKFIRSERLLRSSAAITYNKDTGVFGSGTGTLAAADSRRCFAWAQNRMLLAVGQDMKVKIAPRADKRFSTQVYVSQSIGSTRLEEVGVVEVDCYDPA